MTLKDDLIIYDSMSREKRRFVPIIENKVSMYVCGMTVYDLCHIGHARALIFFDFVAKFLRSIGYDVHYVRNITDVDDKIIKKAREQQISCTDVTTKNIAEMHHDCHNLGIATPDDEPRATAYIAEMIALIENLFKKNLAYKNSVGDVCYRVNNFEGYGRLSRRELSQLQSGARIEQHEGKEDALDFGLWKAAKPDEPSWDSPWGLGRPGWHLECSAMSMSLLGETIDIHGGGVDLQFPHHENEIAQSEGATAKQFVRNWMHVGALQIDNEKMSKSLGNFFTIKDILAKFDFETIRYFMFSTSYRHPLHYSEQQLLAAKKSLKRMYLALRSVKVDVESEVNKDIFKRFKDSLLDDFNTPQALAIMAEVVKKLNNAVTSKNDSSAKQYAQTLVTMGGYFGILQSNPEDYLCGNNSKIESSEIESLLNTRDIARANKDWVQADKIRDELLAIGIEIEDSSSGTTWRRA